jgi:uncharacterized protein
LIKFSTVIILFLVLLGVHYYLFLGLRKIGAKAPRRTKLFLASAWWLWGIFLLVAVWTLPYLPTAMYRGPARSIMMTFFFLDLAGKIPMLLFFLIDDLGIGIRWLYAKLNPGKTKISNGTDISRNAFLKKAGVLAGGLPFAGFSFGILYGAYDYKWRRETIFIPGLPSQFDGLRIGQLSDIHTGSFLNKRAVKAGIEEFNKEKVDIVFFTGDLVNNLASEMKGWLEVFEKVHSPMGVYSILGNHDYGDYSQWYSKQQKARNFNNVLKAHKNMNWDLLRNENRNIEIDGAKLSLIGVENWGAKHRFKKYGDLPKAFGQSSDADLRILLSHDPSHWDAQVRKDFSDIELMLAGHTHGFQMGIENEFLKWSPAQYIYDQWGGLYKKGKQQIYVNRGFGFIGYPGRLGIPPELALLKLKKA